ncbi:MAG: metallophosphoesterase [Promethearchaeota archaeon]|nr:MAG: metallophosphoesterase [Candidatus Lokiarchaeota archaeon]
MFKKAINEIQSIKNVDYIIHLGDLTHDGTYLDYQYALDCIKPINNETFYIIPGNHDAKNVGYLLFEELFGSRGFEFEDDQLFILGFDSSVPDQNSGRIGKRSIEKLKRTFLSIDDKTKVFCFHHQLLPIPLTGRERSTVIDSGDVLEMICESNIDLILNGHRHITNCYSCTNGFNEFVIFNSGNLSCNKTRYRELFTYTIMDIFDKAVNFTTKKLLTDETIERGRYINRVFNVKSPKSDKKLIFKAVNISNTHFSKIMFNEDIFDTAIEQINQMDLDIVIHTGDVTNHNIINEYDMAIKKLVQIKQNKIIIPGSHDLENIGWDLFPEKVGPLEPYFENDKVRIIGINSMDYSITNGIVGRRKTSETVQFLKNQPNQKINIVLLYHNLIPHPRTRYEKMLSDSGNVLKFFTEPENKIHFILTGHDHISFTLQVEDTILTSSGTISSNEYLDLKGNTYNIINCYDDGFVEIDEVVVKTNTYNRIGEYWINLHKE